MQSVLGGSLHKNNTSCLLLTLYHASVNKISIVLKQIPPKMNGIMGFVQVVNDLNQSGLHLNNRGNNILFNNFVNYLDNRSA